MVVHVLQLTGELDAFKTVNEFVSLKSVIINSGSCEAEVKHKIGMANSAMIRMCQI